MMFKENVEKVMKERGVNYYTAKYIVRKGEDNYTPKPRKGVKFTDLIDLGVEPVIDKTSESGYAVYQHGKRRPIMLRKTNQYKYGRQKFHYYTYYAYTDENGKYKQKAISLSALVYCFFNKKDIPAGYVIDHIDNDSFNNDLSNLQMISIGENATKDYKGHNQYNHLDKNE